MGQGTMKNMRRPYMAALAPRRTSDETDPNAPLSPAALREPQPLRPPTVRMTMYFSPEGALHHARCRRPLHFRGIRAEIESDFWCSACHEHVALPRYAVASIPVESEEDRPGAPTNVVRLVRVDAERRSSAG